MQIELVGCTSAGKSTLASAIIHKCRDLGFDIVLDQEFVLGLFRLNWIRNQQLRKLMMNLLGVAASLATWRRNRDFYRFAADQLFHPTSGRIGRVERFHLLRNVLKRIGITEIVRHYARDDVPEGRPGHEPDWRHRQIVLVDEGALQTAHNLFVHLPHNIEEPVTDSPEDVEHWPDIGSQRAEHSQPSDGAASGWALTEGTASALSTFVTLIPLPDVVVYVRQPEELLIQRTMKRGHRRVGDGSYGEVTRFVRQAVSVFDNLVQHPLVADRVLLVESLDGAMPVGVPVPGTAAAGNRSAHNGHHGAMPIPGPAADAEAQTREWQPRRKPGSGSTGASTNHVA